MQACHNCCTLEFSLEKTCDVIGSVHPVRKCSKRSKAEQSGAKRTNHRAALERCRSAVYFAGQVIAKKNNCKPRRTVIKTPDKKNEFLVRLDILGMDRQIEKKAVVRRRLE